MVLSSSLASFPKSFVSHSFCRPLCWVFPHYVNMCMLFSLLVYIINEVATDYTPNWLHSSFPWSSCHILMTGWAD